MSKIKWITPDGKSIDLSSECISVMSDMTWETKDYDSWQDVLRYLTGDPHSQYQATMRFAMPKPPVVWKDKPFIKEIKFYGTTTVCIFHDGTYVSARPQKDEVFCEETGVAMCIAKYIYGSRSKFLKAVDKGKQQ
jgi:hypothetical protein